MSGKKLEFVQSVVEEVYRRKFEPVTTQNPPMVVKGAQELMKSYHSATLKTARQVGEILSLISQDFYEKKGVEIILGRRLVMINKLNSYSSSRRLGRLG